jgi:hypothetical protein
MRAWRAGTLKDLDPLNGWVTGRLTHMGGVCPTGADRLTGYQRIVANSPVLQRFLGDVRVGCAGGASGLRSRSDAS